MSAQHLNEACSNFTGERHFVRLSSNCCTETELKSIMPKHSSCLAEQRSLSRPMELHVGRSRKCEKRHCERSRNPDESESDP